MYHLEDDNFKLSLGTILKDIPHDKDLSELVMTLDKKNKKKLVKKYSDLRNLCNDHSATLLEKFFDIYELYNELDELIDSIKI
jgi:hypothetical protein